MSNEFDRRFRWFQTLKTIVLVIVTLAAISASAQAQPVPLNGQIKEWTVPTASSSPVSLTLDPSGNVFFLEGGSGKVGELNPSTGVITEWQVSAGGTPIGIHSIAFQAPGTVWFTESPGTAIHNIARLNIVTNSLTGWVVPDQGFPTQLNGLAFDPATGNVFAGTENCCLSVIPGADRLVRLVPGTNEVDLWPIPTAGGIVGDVLVTTTGVYFTEVRVFPFVANKIGRLLPGPDNVLGTPDDIIQEFVVPTPNSQPWGLSNDTSGNIWFTERALGGNKIGKLNPLTNMITEFPVPTAASFPAGISVNSVGKPWFMEGNGLKLGVFDPSTPGASILTPPLVTTVPPSVFTVSPPDAALVTTTSTIVVPMITRVTGTETDGFREYPVSTSVGGLGDIVASSIQSKVAFFPNVGANRISLIHTT